MNTFPPELLVAIAGHALSGALLLGVSAFVATQKWRKLENQLFFFMIIGVFLYEVFFIIAALQTSYAPAYFWWSLNIVDVFIVMFVVHFVLRVAGKDKVLRWYIILSYGVGIAILLAARLEPSWFLPTVLPKAYFFYYLEGGWLYGVMLAYFLGFPLVPIVNLTLVYRSSTGVERKRFEYFILMFVIAYLFGSINFLPVFDVPIDPILGLLTGFCMLPIAYGIFANDLLDIRIAVRRTFYYALAIAAVTAFLVVLLLLNSVLARVIPELQFWMLPLIVALIALAVGRLVLWQLNESERLKYEFITVATHKLRTPLTEIRWSIAEMLEHPNVDDATRTGLAHIDEAANRLVELTNALIEVSHSGEATALQKAPVDLVPLTQAALERFKTETERKKIVVTTDFSKAVRALAAERAVASMIDVLVENAVHYTTIGSIAVYIAPDDRGNVRFSVTDTGIGIAPENRKSIFSGFFRADSARIADTEGTGLGLSLLKNLAERQGGTVGFDSPGTDLGSTFWFTLPKA